MKQALIRQWQQWTLRERRMVLLMAVVLGGAFYYLAVWEPLNRQTAKLAANVSRLQGELQQVKTLAQEAKTLTAKPALPPLAASDLQPLLQQVLQDHAISGLSLQAEGGQGVRLSGEVSFNDWMRALAALSDRQISVTRMNAEATGQPGRIRLDAVLVHAGGEA